MGLSLSSCNRILVINLVIPERYIPLYEAVLELHDPPDPARLTSKTSVNCIVPEIKDQAVIGWRGMVMPEPGSHQEANIIHFLPEGTGEVSIRAERPELQSIIDDLRDSDQAARFWGVLRCGVDEYNRCILETTRIEKEYPLPTPFGIW